MAISVAVAVGDEVADKLVAALTSQIKTLKIGNGMSGRHGNGPLVSAAQPGPRSRAMVDQA